MNTVTDSEGNRYHVLGDGYKVQCTASRLTEDCQLCNKDKEREILEWIKKHQRFCLLCDERPICYRCLRKDCKHWCADKQLLEEYGSLKGCAKLVLNTYCSDFNCKYHFLGWWSPNWKKQRQKMRKRALKILKEKAKTKTVKRQEKHEKNAPVAKTPKKKKRSTGKAVVVRKPQRNKIRRDRRPITAQPMAKRDNGIHRKKRIPMRKSRG